MCGIAGIVSLNGKPIIDGGNRIHTMLKLLHHRGPDKQGVFFSPDGWVALGNTRLAIGDTITPFEVPMISWDGDAILTYNGEVFNYREERARLERQGIVFRTHSDTEVVLAALQKEGEQCLSRFDGFWGFALYEISKKRLLLGRDLLGKRHVFYYQNYHEFVFSSEINPILAVVKESWDIDIRSLLSSFEFRSAPPGATLVKKIFRLQAGYHLTIELASQKMHMNRALKLHPEKWFDFFEKNPSETEILEQCDALIAASCQARIPMEVGYIATLSGGLDSTLMNVYLSRFKKGLVDTLHGRSTRAAPQKGDDVDEWMASRWISRHLNTRHFEFDMLDDSAVKLYQQQAANSFDGVFSEGLVKFYQLAMQAKQHQKKVLLLSDGPDEFLGGYDRDIAAYRLEQRMSNGHWNGKIVRHFCRTALGRKILYKIKAKHLLNWSWLSKHPFYFKPAHSSGQYEVLRQLFDFNHVVIPHTLDSYGTIPSDYADLLSELDISQCMALSYATRSLSDYYNLRTDRAVMFASIELRLPMQTTDLVEFMIAVPAQWRFYSGRWSKYLFRKLVEKHVGTHIAYRHKYGFAYPGWMDIQLAKKLDLESTIQDSSIFNELPFKKNAKRFFLQTPHGHYRWMAYCLARSYERLKNRDFEVNVM